MLGRLQSLVMTGVALGAAPLALAAETKESTKNPAAFDFIQFSTTLVVFVVSLAILGKLVWPKILSALDEREQKILGEIEKAEKARSDADAALKEYERSLAEARQRADEMIEKTKAEQSRLAAQLKQEAEAELSQMRAAARRDIDAAKRAAVAEVYQEAATVAAAVAEKILRRELNDQDQSRLVDETLHEIGREYAPAGA